MNHGSLFSGIGGFDLASEWMDWNNIFHCEWNPFGKSILKEHYKKSISHEDITKTDFTIYRGRIDILSGGFPCQPYSAAGKRKGKEDDRHLWPEMLRAIREIQPIWVVGENVRGLTNWNGGVVFDEVQADLEAEGYEVTPFLLPACSVNAPHRRDRIWFVAYSNSNRSNGRSSISYGIEKRETIGTNLQFETSGFSFQQSITNTKGISSERKLFEQHNERKFRGCNSRNNEWTTWNNFPTQSPICNGNDGFSSELLRQRIRKDSMGIISEEEIDKILSAAYSQWRKETIKAGGNAIVPQVAYQIFKSIQEYENINL